MGIEEQMKRLCNYLESVMDRGMVGCAGAVWPVIIRRWGKSDDGISNYVYQYPQAFFDKLISENGLYISAKNKSDLITILKTLVDKKMNDEIDIHLYHLGLHVISPYKGSSFRDAMGSIGKRRSAYAAKLPRYELKNNDDFISSIYSDLITRRYPEVGEEIVQLPAFKDVRLLFTPDQFAAYTGSHYFDADWLEPVPGIRIEVKKWVGEKDPMTPQLKKEGMIEGQIILGHEGQGSLRHFVNGEPIHAGSYIEVKFGDGWIPGRYEWSFQQESPIRIYSSREEWFSIKEGHLVRILIN